MTTGSFVVFCGGVGGSKLADGLARILPPEKLTIVVNTADDFYHLGLRICPDIDTVTYMLAGLVDAERGWGRGDETWDCMSTLETLEGESWFRLGDRDLALHLHRTHLLKRGATLETVTKTIARRFGVAHRIIPMTEEPVATVVDTEDGELAFQDYFVRRRCEPVVKGYRYEGIERARPTPSVLDALGAKDLAGIIFAPSNPILSIGPILGMEGLSKALVASRAPTIAVSPIIGGAAVKGPAAKLMQELGRSADIAGIAAFYGSLLQGLVIDTEDVTRTEGLSVRSRATNSLMRDGDDRERVARFCLDFLGEFR